MNTEKILLAIEAMTEIDRMAKAAECYGYSLVVLAEDVSYYGEAEKATIVEFPTRDFTALSNYIRENRSRIAQIFSVTDTWGVEASQVRDVFDFPQFGSTQRLRRLRDKHYVQESLKQAGLAQEVVAYPRILKAKNGTGKIGVHYVGSEQELQELVENKGVNLDDYMQQNYYRGPMYSAEVWRDDSQFVFFGITNRILADPPSFVEKVKSFPWAVGSIWEKQVEQWVKEILESLDYTFGLAHLEFIETCDGFELVEINCRMAGAMITPGILATTNYDPYRMAVEQALGATIKIPDKRLISGGFSHLSIYAERCGEIVAVQGIDNLKLYPGALTWHPSKHEGDIIQELDTYRSRIGNITAKGHTAEIAQDRVIAGSKEIKVGIG